MKQAVRAELLDDWNRMELHKSVILLLLLSILVAAAGAVDERASLLEFKRRSAGSLGLQNWELSRPVCQWDGVGCDDKGLGVVVSLELSDKGLNGSLPSELFTGLPSLSMLDLSSNRLEGVIPWEVGNATQLRVLDLSSNLLQGGIPPSLGNLVDLEELWLVDNDFLGPIPEAIGMCANLVQLGIGGSSTGEEYSQNGVNGTIPAALANCSALQVLQIAGTQVTGELPRELASLHALTRLNLSVNGLTGPVPPWLANLTRLQVLDLRYNALGGAVPWELGMLDNLVELQLGPKAVQYVDKYDGYIYGFPFPTNIFSGLGGSLPSSLGRLWRLRVLRVTDTLLEGSIPLSVSNCTSLEVLDLSSNALTGSVPENLPETLQVLALYANKLEGHIPAALSNLTELRQLVLHFNSFSGPVPPGIVLCSMLQLLSFGGAADGETRGFLTGPLPRELGRLSELSRLAVMSAFLDGDLPPSLANCSKLRGLGFLPNAFSGSIPEGFANLSTLETFFLGANAFTGSISSFDWGRLSSLRILTLRENRFTAEIPESVGDLPLLEYLDLNSNMFSGSLPQSLKNHTRLRRLCVANNLLSGDIGEVFDLILPAKNALELFIADRNRFTGTLPDWLDTFPHLQILVLASNELEGPIPESITNIEAFRQPPSNMDDVVTVRSGAPIVEIQVKGVYLSYYSILSSLTLLDLSHNRLSGTIPWEMGGMIGLHYLNLSSNALTGPIPSSLGNMAELNQMDVSFNQLSGEIPWQLSKLSKMESFDVSYNNLAGPIPNLGPLFSSFSGAFNGNPGLCGDPLPVNCTDTSPSDHAESHDVMTRDTPISYAGLVVGFLGSFVTVLCVLLYTNAGWDFVTCLARFCNFVAGHCKGKSKVKKGIIPIPKHAHAIFRACSIAIS